MRYGQRDLVTAVREVVLGELPVLHGEGGVIAIDRKGEISMEFNSEGMFRACRKAGGEPEVHIYRAD
jgi:beta-aspartyl-peptidase (threonine type)